MDAALIFRFVLTIFNGILAAGGLYAVVQLVLNQPTTLNQALIGLVAMVVGAFIANFGQSNGWWFGSSKGSSDKTQLINRSP